MRVTATFLQVIHESMIETITALKAKHYIGVVSGSDLSKVNEQLTKEGRQRGIARSGHHLLPLFLVVKSLDFCFCENGLYALKSGEFFAKKVISQMASSLLSVIPPPS